MKFNCQMFERFGINKKSSIVQKKVASVKFKVIQLHLMYLKTILLLAGLFLAQPLTANPTQKTCIVPASGSSSIDDTPAVLDAFQTCGHGGKIIFSNTTYHINSIMNTTGLRDCEIDLRGTLLVSYPIILHHWCM